MVMDGELENESLTGSFSQLLDSVHGGGFDMRTNFAYPSSCFPLGNSPTMLCFEQKVSNEEKTQKFQKPQTQKTYKISGGGAAGGGGGGESTSTSSSNNSSGSSGVTKTKRTQCGEPKASTQERKQSKAPNPTPNPKSTTNETTTSSKKPKTTVRKEKLGERIAALQQLVSPFGKTDTASVLHEAMGYIRFLHDQVQVLSSPYLSSTTTHQMSCDDGVEEEEKGSRYDLKSRGLCLVPLEWTANVASSNGADLWSPVTGGKQGSQPQQYHGSSLC